MGYAFVTAEFSILLKVTKVLTDHLRTLPQAPPAMAPRGNMATRLQLTQQQTVLPVVTQKLQTTVLVELLPQVLSMVSQLLLVDRTSTKS